ncbi:MAG: ATP-binding cassette domain-containing protein [Erysipelotrichaceae bacterium]|nr:ATP-binding cassette domain-containing protein [Erysipelotrichaceae bacterium]
MLKVEGLSKFYGKNKGIENLSFTVEAGEILGIIGTNGSGKTTTFRLLLGLLLPDQGMISYQNAGISQCHNRVFGYLPEERSVYRDLKVTEQLRFLASLKEMDKAVIQERMNYWLQRLDIEEYRNRPIRELSKGNQQKVQLVCALIHDPDIVILDEPLTGLDVINVRLFKNIINELKSAGKLILISSHQYEYIEEFCEKIILLKSGDVQYNGTVSKLRKTSAQRYISVLSDVYHDYLPEDGVIKQQSFGNVVRLTIENSTKAKKLLRKLLKEEAIMSVTLGLPTLGDIIQAKVLI